MSTLFVTHPGQVCKVPLSVGTLPLTIFLTDWPGYPAIRAIMTHVGVQSYGNYQFLHTLKEYIYLYVFGERIGDVMLNGLLFAEACETEGGGGTAPPTGFEQLMDYYNKHRVAVRGAPITIMIGVNGLAVFQAFLVSQRLEIIDPQSQLGQFSLIFKNLTPEALQS